MDCSSLAKILSFILVLLIGVFISLFNQPPIQRNLEPGHYVLALQWGESFCRNETRPPCRQPVPRTFTIHFFGKYNSSCEKGPDLYPGDVASIRERLVQNWPNLLIKKTDFEFWRYEWKKHGRCLGSKAEQYFRGVLDSKKRFEDEIGSSLLQFFVDKGLPPSNTRRYDPLRFLRELQKKAGIITQMQCNNNKNDYHLLEIKVCYNENWQLTDCPTRAREAFIIGKCYKSKGPILFPARTPASPPPLKQAQLQVVVGENDRRPQPISYTTPAVKRDNGCQHCDAEISSSALPYSVCPHGSSMLYNNMSLCTGSKQNAVTDSGDL